MTIMKELGCGARMAERIGGVKLQTVQRNYASITILPGELTISIHVISHMPHFSY
jgi:hypothetical protein